MKKLLALLLAAVLAVSFAACGKKEAGKQETAVEPETVYEATAPEEEAGAPLDDAALIAKTVEQLLGVWTVASVDQERLTFNADGTGTYVGILDKDLAFTYTVSVAHKAYANGEEYVETMLNINYDTGESEEITATITEENGLKMVFHLDGSGYSGVMNYIDAWIKA